MSSTSSLQKAVFAISLVLLAWSLAGLVANPDFATAPRLSSTRVLGVDFNGWHALSGVFLFAPGVVASRRADWSLVYALGAIVSLVASGAWALADSAPAGLLPFPNQNADAALHFGSAIAYGLALTAEAFFYRRRAPVSA